MKRTGKLLALVLCLLCLLSVAAPAAAGADSGICNVIFMIGDGMGYNHLKMAEEQGYDIWMDDAPDLMGWSRTRSANNDVTDSAAGATALACGVRTNNDMLAVYPEQVKRGFVQPRSLTENAALHGMRTGVVTTDQTNGATPAAFSVHALSRSDTEDIVAQQLQCGVDLIWGKAQSAATQSATEEAGRVYVSDSAGMDALSAGSRSYGQFTNSLWKLNPQGNSPTLQQMSEKALALLTEGNDKGFFLMIEGAHIDKHSHSSQDGVYDYPEKLANAAEAVKAFDNTIRAMVEFARADGHTLVIITADHETGDLRYEESNGRMTYHSAGHSGANVPVFVYGANDLFQNGAEFDNRDIANMLAGKLGWTERFPIEDAATDQKTGESASKTRSFFWQIWANIRDFFLRIGDFFRSVFKIG
jgi:alkaline phosphatase